VRRRRLMQPNDLLTAGEAAAVKGVHPKAIYRAIKEERLKAERRGKGILLIRYEDLVAWRGQPGRPRKETNG
jgi:excisionase family DNA binding protein